MNDEKQTEPDKTPILPEWLRITLIVISIIVLIFIIKAYIRRIPLVL